MKNFIKGNNQLLLSLGSLLLMSFWQADTGMGTDTSSESYKRQYDIGYKIGEWLPFIIIITLAILVIVRTQRLSRGRGER